MSQENVEVVRQAYQLLRDASQAVRTGLALDDEALAAVLDPDFVLVEVADYPDADSHRGFQGFRRWLEAYWEIYDEAEIIPGEPVWAGTDAVVVITHQRFRSKTGVLLEQDVTHVWHLRNGRVVCVTGYRDHAQALEAVGLRE